MAPSAHITRARQLSNSADQSSLPCSFASPSNACLVLRAALQYVDREEKENLRLMLEKMTGLDPAGLESEQKLVELLQRFDIVPTTELRRALMDWKVKGWEDVFKWKTMP